MRGTGRGRGDGRIFLLLLAAVLLTGLGRILMLPPFEGVDETAHYSRIEEAAFAPSSPAHMISADVESYARAGPMPLGWILARRGRDTDVSALLATGERTDLGLALYPAFFAKDDKVSRYARLYRETPGSAAYAPGREQNWQYQHPPLYYSLLAPVLRAAAALPLVSRLLVLRLAGFLAAFAAFAGALAATRRHPGLEEAAVLGAAYPFLTPVFFSEFGRIGNDTLCLVIFSLAWVLLLRHLRDPRGLLLPAALGATLGLGWLAKAFMIPVSAGVLLFLAARGWGEEEAMPRRLAPALMAGAAALLVGAWPYLADLRHGHFLGSAEFAHLAAQQGVEFSARKAVSAVFILVLSFVYYFSDATVSAGLLPLALALLAGTILVLRAAARLPRDPRAVEWLPLWTGAPLAAGLVLHLILFDLRDGVTTTPAYYLHVLAPALAMIFGLGLAALRCSGGGRMLGLLLAGAVAANAAIMSAAQMLYAGCARFTADGGLAVGGPACQSGIIFARLSLLAWPQWGVPCLMLGLALAGAAAWLCSLTPLPAPSTLDRDTAPAASQ
jgi:hypothetical protein